MRTLKKLRQQKFQFVFYLIYRSNLHVTSDQLNLSFIRTIVTEFRCIHRVESWEYIYVFLSLVQFTNHQDFTCIVRRRNCRFNIYRRLNKIISKFVACTIWFKRLTRFFLFGRNILFRVFCWQIGIS